MFDVQIPHKIEVHLKMANYDKLNADIKILSDKVDALIEKANAPVVVPEPVVVPDEQPAVDAADDAINAVIAKIP
jgi:hypothetical protein